RTPTGGAAGGVKISSDWRGGEEGKPLPMRGRAATAQPTNERGPRSRVISRALVCASEGGPVRGGSGPSGDVGSVARAVERRTSRRDSPLSGLWRRTGQHTPFGVPHLAESPTPAKRWIGAGKRGPGGKASRWGPVGPSAGTRTFIWLSIID